MISKPEVKDDLGRVTAGIPSLGSPKRFQHDTAVVSREYRKAIEQETQKKIDISVAPDGDRPIDIADAARGKSYTPAQVMQKLTKLNPNLWFERSGTVPSQMMACLRVPVSEDHPKGLKFIGGFPADAMVTEHIFHCTQERWTHTRDGVMRKMKEPCSNMRCKVCGGLRTIPGWYSLVTRLVQMRLINKYKAEMLFGFSHTQNQQRAMNGA